MKHWIKSSWNKNNLVPDLAIYLCLPNYISECFNLIRVDLLPAGIKPPGSLMGNKQGYVEFLSSSEKCWCEQSVLIIPKSEIFPDSQVVCFLCNIAHV